MTAAVKIAQRRGRERVHQLAGGDPATVELAVMLGWDQDRRAITLDLTGATPEWVTNLICELTGIRTALSEGRVAR